MDEKHNPPANSIITQVQTNQTDNEDADVAFLSPTTANAPKAKASTCQ